MSIKVGDKIPSVPLKHMGKDGIETVNTDELFKGKKVVLFAVPGAFTPTCSEQHLPGFLQQAAAFKAKGIDTIACVAVNDPFVLNAWDKASAVDGRIELLSDGNAEFTKAIGLDFDASAVGLGTRSKRYAMVVDDGVVRTLLIEDVPSKAQQSSAEAVLATL